MFTDKYLNSKGLAAFAIVIEISSNCNAVSVYLKNGSVGELGIL